MTVGVDNNAAFYKEVYGDDGPKALIPAQNKLQTLIKFAPKAKQLGNKFNQSVKTTRSNGFTYLAPAAANLALAPVNSFTTQNASVVGSQIIGREQISYEANARAQDNVSAWKELYGYAWEQLQVDCRYRKELELLYGQTGLAVVDSCVSDTVTFTEETWASGLWALSEGAQVQFFDSTGATERTAGDTCYIEEIDAPNRTVTFDYSGGGGLSGDGVTAGDKIYFFAQRTTSGSNSMVGLHEILSNTTATLFGIDPTIYSIWKGTQLDLGGAALNQAALNEVIGQAVSRGLYTPIDVFVSPTVWGTLLDSQSALRRYADRISGGKVGGFENGAEEITFYSQNGKVSIHSHPYVWDGYAYGIVKEDFLRVGAVDFTTRIPGTEDIVFHLPSDGAFEIRCYSNEALLPSKIGGSFIVSGIV